MVRVALERLRADGTLVVTNGALRCDERRGAPLNPFGGANVHRVSCVHGNSSHEPTTPDVAGFATLRITDQRLKQHATTEAERLRDILRSRSF